MYPVLVLVVLRHYMKRLNEELVIPHLCKHCTIASKYSKNLRISQSISYATDGHSMNYLEYPKTNFTERNSEYEVAPSRYYITFYSKSYIISSLNVR